MWIIENTDIHSDIEKIVEKEYKRPQMDYSKIRVGVKTLTDALLDLGTLKKVNPNLADKELVLDAIDRDDIETMREISEFFFKTSGIYSRLCRYMAYLYRYDWFVTPFINSKAVNQNKILDDFNKVLLFLDNFGVKKFFGEVALKVIKKGCYYGYIVENNGKTSIQDLPIKYCRSRFFASDRTPIVEFNMKYFDDNFKDSSQRQRILNIFPSEFKKGYQLYKKNKLKPDFIGDSTGWFLLDPKYTIKFYINEKNYPPFISVIPSIIDLDEAQGLDRKKMAQKLLKIIIQKLPYDKNGDPIFDDDEAADMHVNAVRMLGNSIGVDVLTTYAEVNVEDMADNTSTATSDELEKVERTVYNEAGVSQMQFNTDGNIALEKSILNDEAYMYNLVLQFELFLNKLIIKFNKNPKKVLYKAQILNTTIYNYKDTAKTYKELVSMGYSKVLPLVALGHSQSTILATAYFENQILDLSSVFIPPLSSNTMNADTLDKISGEEKKVGRTEKSDDEKSDKTIANREAMN